LTPYGLKGLFFMKSLHHYHSDYLLPVGDPKGYSLTKKAYQASA